jgi:glutamate synthase (NADPH/NADH) small chain
MPKTMPKKKTIRTIPQDRAPMPVQDPKERAGNFAEVALGFRLEDALTECARCLDCPSRACVDGCPVGIDIPAFIQKVSDKDFRAAYEILTEANLLPAICGRVCPQEDQCEGVCPVGDTLEPVAIGRIERWVGDLAIEQGWSNLPYVEPKGFRIAIVGSGPAGCATAFPSSACPTA